MIVTDKIIDFILFSLVEENLNSDYGSSSSLMWDSFQKYTKWIINKINKNEILIPGVSKNKFLDLLININIEDIKIRETTYSIHEIDKSFHSMKLIMINNELDHNKNHCVFINTGYEQQDKIFEIKKIGITNKNEIISDINNMYNISDIYSYISRFKNYDVVDIEKINGMFSNQISGSCTYYSTLYTILYIIINEFTLHDEFVHQLINIYRDNTKEYSLEIIKNINIDKLLESSYSGSYYFIENIDGDNDPDNNYSNYEEIIEMYQKFLVCILLINDTFDVYNEETIKKIKNRYHKRISSDEYEYENSLYPDINIGDYDKFYSYNIGESEIDYKYAYPDNYVTGQLFIESDDSEITINNNVLNLLLNDMTLTEIIMYIEEDINTFYAKYTNYIQNTLDDKIEIFYFLIWLLMSWKNIKTIGYITILNHVDKFVTYMDYKFLDKYFILFNMVLGYFDKSTYGLFFIILVNTLNKFSGFSVHMQKESKWVKKYTNDILSNFIFPNTNLYIVASEYISKNSKFIFPFLQFDDVWLKYGDTNIFLYKYLMLSIFNSQYNNFNHVILYDSEKPHPVLKPYKNSNYFIHRKKIIYQIQQYDYTSKYSYLKLITNSKTGSGLKFGINATSLFGMVEIDGVFYDIMRNNETYISGNMDPNLLIDPFDIPLINNFDKSKFNVIYNSLHPLLIPDEIKGNKYTTDMFSSYKNTESNFYSDSKREFIKKFGSINIKTNPLFNKYAVYVLCMYYYYYDVDIKGDTFEYMVSIVNQLCKDNDFINLCDDKIEYIKNTLKRIEKSERYGFVDILFLRKISKRNILGLLANTNSLNNVEMSNNPDFDIMYKYKDEIYYSSKKMKYKNSESIINAWYTPFKKLYDNKIYYFSNVSPVLIEDDDIIYHADSSMIYQNIKEIDKNDDIKIKMDLSTNFIIFKDQDKTRVYQNYYNINDIDTDDIIGNQLYETIRNGKNYLFDEEIIEKYRGIGNHPYLKSELTSKHLYIFLISEHIINFDKKIFGERYFIDNSYSETLKNEIKIKFDTLKNKTNNILDYNKGIYLKYDITTRKIMEDVHEITEIIDIELNNDDISSYILLYFLNISYSYDMLLNKFNHFISRLNIDFVINYMNHPYTYLIIDKLRTIYSMPSCPSKTSNNKKTALIINPIKMNLIKKKTSNKNFPLGIDNKKYLISSLFQFRQNQKECIDNIINSFIDDKYTPMLYKLVMGFGKSKIIIPGISYECLHKNIYKKIYVVAPQNLVSEMYESLYRLLDKLPLCILKLNDDNNIKRGIIVISDKLLKNNFIVYNHSIPNTDYGNKCTNENKLNTSLISKEYIYDKENLFIIDEIDDCIDPLKSNYNIRQNEMTFNNYIISKFGEEYGTIFMDKFFGFIIGYTQSLMINHNVDINDVIKKYYLESENVMKCVTGECLDEKSDDINTIYCLLKIYRCSSLIKSGKFIENRHYGLGINQKKNTYYYAIPYTGVNIPSENGEFNDIYLILLLTCKIIMNNKFKLRVEDIERIVQFIINNKTIIVDERLISLSENYVNIYDINYDNYDHYYEKINEYNLDNYLKITYLTNIILKEIVVCTNYFNTSFMELLNPNVSGNYIGFTGTPEYLGKIDVDDTPKYPIINNREIFGEINSSYTKPDSEIKNLTINFYNDDNMTYVDINEDNILNFIKQNNINPGKKKINCLIDTGCIFRYERPGKYAEIFFNTLDFNYILYFDNNDSLIKLWKNNGDFIHSVEKKLKTEREILEISKNEYFILFDNNHVRGTDISLPLNTHALVTITAINNSVNTIQGIFRLRKIGNGETCQFIVDRDLKNNIGTIGLYNYLEFKKNQYLKEQESELLVQTINANVKYRENFKNFIFYNISTEIIPNFENKNISEIYVNHNLKNITGAVCKNKSNFFSYLVQYCQKIKEYIHVSHYELTTSTNISREINANENIEFTVIPYKKYSINIYKDYIPLYTNYNWLEIFKEINSSGIPVKYHTYLSFYSYLQYQKLENDEEKDKIMVDKTNLKTN